MLILPWISAVFSVAPLKAFESADSAVSRLRRALESAAAQTTELGFIEVQEKAISELIPLIEKIRVEVGKIEVGAAIASRDPQERMQSKEASSRKVPKKYGRSRFGSRLKSSAKAPEHEASSAGPFLRTENSAPGSDFIDTTEPARIFREQILL